MYFYHFSHSRLMKRDSLAKGKAIRLSLHPVIDRQEFEFPLSVYSHQNVSGNLKDLIISDNLANC
jgi:hypothetical protein